MEGADGTDELTDELAKSQGSRSPAQPDGLKMSTTKAGAEDDEF